MFFLLPFNYPEVLPTKIHGIQTIDSFNEYENIYCLIANDFRVRSGHLTPIAELMTVLVVTKISITMAALM